MRGLLGTEVRDCDCALKLFRREVIQSIDIETTGFFFNAELLTKARQQGRSIVEVGVTHRPRPRGESTVSGLHAIPVAATLLRALVEHSSVFSACAADAKDRRRLVR